MKRVVYKVVSNLVDIVLINDSVKAGKDGIHARHCVHDVAGRPFIDVGNFNEQDRHAFEGL